MATLSDGGGGDTPADAPSLLWMFIDGGSSPFDAAAYAVKIHAGYWALALQDTPIE